MTIQYHSTPLPPINENDNGKIDYRPFADRSKDKSEKSQVGNKFKNDKVYLEMLETPRTEIKLKHLQYYSMTDDERMKQIAYWYEDALNSTFTLHLGGRGLCRNRTITVEIQQLFCIIQQLTQERSTSKSVRGLVKLQEKQIFLLHFIIDRIGKMENSVLPFAFSFVKSLLNIFHWEVRFQKSAIRKFKDFQILFQLIEHSLTSSQSYEHFDDYMKDVFHFINRHISVHKEMFQSNELFINQKETIELLSRKITSMYDYEPHSYNSECRKGFPRNLQSKPNVAGQADDVQKEKAKSSPLKELQKMQKQHGQIPAISMENQHYYKVLQLDEQKRFQAKLRLQLKEQPREFYDKLRKQQQKQHLELQRQAYAIETRDDEEESPELDRDLIYLEFLIILANNPFYCKLLIENEHIEGRMIHAVLFGCPSNLCMIYLLLLLQTLTKQSHKSDGLNRIMWFCFAAVAPEIQSLYPSKNFRQKIDYYPRFTNMDKYFFALAHIIVRVAEMNETFRNEIKEADALPHLNFLRRVLDK
ncbi:hypothetical protein SNEBB_009825 [Seison nebaliae]|nr:hypothetical protein SNEBB_009825 [Seison nebaliae]